MKHIFLLIATCLLAYANSNATVRVTAGSGNWNSTGTWSGGVVPAANDDVIIVIGHTVTINVSPNNIFNATIDGTLQFDATGTGRVWTVTGNFTVHPSGSFICSAPGSATTHTFNYNGTNLSNQGNFNMVNGSNKCNVVIGGSATQTIGGTASLSFNKLTINNTGGKFNISYDAGDFTPSETSPTKLTASITTADTLVVKQGLLIGCAVSNSTIAHTVANFKMGSGTSKMTSSVNIFTSVVTITVNTGMILNDATNSNVSMNVTGSFTSPSMSQSNAATAYGLLGPSCFGGASNATTLDINGTWNMTDIFVFVGNTKLFGGTEPNNPTITAHGGISWASSETHTIDLPFTSDDFYIQTTYFGLFDSQGAFPEMILEGGSIGSPNTFNVAFDVFDGEVQYSEPGGSPTYAQISESFSNWTINGNWKINAGASLAVHSDNTLTVNGTLRVASTGEIAGSETETDNAGYIPTNGPSLLMGSNGVLYVENASGLGKGLLSEAGSNVAIKNRTSDIDWNLNSISSSGTIEYAASGAQTVTDRTYNHLSTSGNGTKTLANAIAANGTLTIGTSTTLANAGFNTNALSHVVNNGTHSGTGKLRLVGTSNQSLSGTGSDWGNIQLNNSSGATCNQAVTTSGTVDLDAGELITSSGAKLSLTASGNYTGGSNSSFVNGPMSKSVNSTAEFIFPIGKNGTFRQLSVKPTTATSSTFTAEYFDIPYVNTTTVQSPLISVSNVEYWQVDRSGGAVSATVKLYWGPSSNFIDTLGLRVARWSGTKWVNFGITTSSGNASLGNIESGVVTAFNKPFTFGRVAVAPANTITTGTLPLSSFCPEVSLNVPFTSTGTFNGGNIYTAQLSNNSGNFSSPTAIGTLNSTANAGNISSTLPAVATSGSGYRIRVVSSDPVVTGSDNGSNFTIQSCAKPTGLAASGITNSSATVSWNAVNCASKYKIQYRVQGTIPFTSVNSTNTSKVLNGLTGATTYEYKVQTYCTPTGTTKSKFTALQTFTTAAFKDQLTVADDDQFNLYPNPATKSVHIEITSKSSSSVIITVLNSVGQSMMVNQFELTEGINSVNLNIQSLPAGVYFVEVANGNWKETKKLVKSDHD